MPRFFGLGAHRMGAVAGRQHGMFRIGGRGGADLVEIVGDQRLGGFGMGRGDDDEEVALVAETFTESSVPLTSVPMAEAARLATSTSKAMPRA